MQAPWIINTPGEGRLAARARSKYVCGECGHEEPKWLGRCPQCGAWNSFTEEAPKVAHSARGGANRTAPAAVALGEIPVETDARVSTGMAELDRVLGGGIAPGTSILIGGEPGIGKSTLMLQMAAQVSRRSVLYISGEEAAAQIARRADRLGVSNPELQILTDHRLDAVLASIDAERPKVVIVDSLQTIASAEVGATPGTPNQMKLAAYEIAERCRAHDTTVFLVAHVTKEGSIAGPKLVEHLVDVVLYFEQTSDETRFLRATKNRLGSTDEVGLFTMGAQGLRQVSNPSSLFLVDRADEVPHGVTVAPVLEGSRVLLVEVQALTVPAKSGVSRIFSDRIDSRRVGRMAAVLERHVGLTMSDHDIYVNIAGGIQIREVGIELPTALAIYSARTDRRFPAGMTAVGEVSLAGEVRPVVGIHRRVRAARELGFGQCIGPRGVRPTEHDSGEQWRATATLVEAIKAVFGADPRR